MSYPLNNVTTADQYTAANTLENLPPCSRVNIDVQNASIYWTIQQATPDQPRNPAWNAEIFMIPGSRTIVRPAIVGVRVRSAKAGTPAQVTVEVVP